MDDVSLRSLRNEVLTVVGLELLSTTHGSYMICWVFRPKERKKENTFAYTQKWTKKELEKD